MPSTDILHILSLSISYDSHTGTLTWTRHAVTPPRHRGRPVETKNYQGYLQFEYLNRVWVAHRVAWFLHYGEWPKHQIIHGNGDKTDNRLTNLNRRNIVDQIPLGASGIRGVYRHANRKSRPWFVMHTPRDATGARTGPRRYLGCYATKEEAAAALRAAQAASQTPAVADAGSSRAKLNNTVADAVADNAQTRHPLDNPEW